jgi:arginyl-tRNA synthetase
VKNLIETLLRQALAALPDELVPAAARGIVIEVDHARDPLHGDFASNVAMRLAKAARQNPRTLASALAAALPQNAAIAKVEVAGAGFINFFLTEGAYHGEIARSRLRAIRDGRPAVGRGGIRVGESDRTLACRPRPPCRIRRHTRQSARSGGLPRDARVLRQ